MTLIRCEDCSREVSVLAPFCPNCGRPVSQEKVPIPFDSKILQDTSAFNSFSFVEALSCFLLFRMFFLIPSIALIQHLLWAKYFTHNQAYENLFYWVLIFGNIFSFLFGYAGGQFKLISIGLNWFLEKRAFFPMIVLWAFILLFRNFAIPIFLKESNLLDGILWQIGQPYLFRFNILAKHYEVLHTYLFSVANLDVGIGVYLTYKLYTLYPKLERISIK